MADEELPEVAEHEDAPESAETIDAPEQQLDNAAPDLETFASRMGWTPKDQWRGDPDKWKPVDQFMEDTVSINQTLNRKLKNIERDTRRIIQANERLTEKQIAEERERLNARLDQAVDEGDRETVGRVTTRLAKLEQEAPRDPDVSEFVERNAEWFNVDPEATALAMGVAENLSRQGKSHAEQVAAAERAVKKRFPELFDEPAPKPQGKGPAAVHTSQTRSAPRARSGPKGFADLPAAAKETALRMESRGRCSRDEYAKVYWQEPENA